MERFTYTCPCCGRTEVGLPALVFDRPYAAAAIAQAQFESRVRLTDDLCAVDGEHFFIRSVLELPIVGETDSVEFGVWGSVSAQNFEHYLTACAEHREADLEPMFSWFSNELPLYEPTTLNLRANVVPKGGGRRPCISFDPSQDHPLIRDLACGISRERAIEFAALVLPKH